MRTSKLAIAAVGLGSLRSSMDQSLQIQEHEMCVLLPEGMGIEHMPLSPETGCPLVEGVLALFLL